MAKRRVVNGLFTFKVYLSMCSFTTRDTLT